MGHRGTAGIAPLEKWAENRIETAMTDDAVNMPEDRKDMDNRETNREIPPKQ